MITGGARLSDEQAMFLESVDAIARDRVEPVAAAIDAEGAIPQDLVQLLIDTELLMVDVPLEQGGSGGDLATLALTLQRLARASGSVSAVVGASHTYATAWQASDTPDPVRLSGVASGCWGTIADGGATPIRAERSGDGLRVTGRAAAVEASELATAVLVIAWLPAGEPVVAELSAGDIKWGDTQERTGLRGVSYRAADFQATRLAPDGVLGGAPVLAALRRHQQVAAATCALGIADAALTKAIDYMDERRQFGRSLAEFAGLRAIVTAAQDRVAAAAALLDRAVDIAQRRPADAAMAQACRAAGGAVVATCSDAIQLHGGYGYTVEYGVERLMRDAISARARTIAVLPQRERPASRGESPTAMAR